MKDLLRAFDVWEPAGEEALWRFRLVEKLGTGSFAVVTADFVRPMGDDVDRVARSQEDTFHEQLLTALELQYFDSVAAAIQDHRRSFDG